MQIRILFLVSFIVLSANAFSQSSKSSGRDSVPGYKFSASSPWLTFTNFGEEKTNTHHYEFHFKYALTSKDKIGIKVATWKLFAPMGIPLWNPNIMKESEFYPGRIRETGIGATYQRMIWKGLFATVEIVPQLKTYLDKQNKKIGNGFKLYTSYHIGYQITFFKNRLFIEPQIHCQYWPIDTNAPLRFKEIESKWNNYFLFEPNLYIGINF
ncbi:MAG: hypothetical protein LBU37_05345 [Tannerellaceae bacterium]|jgi:hypothetical protein|nr:hypothetical protein [Tannerellaceae bacterium]